MNILCYIQTIGAAFSGKTITINGKNVEVAIWVKLLNFLLLYEI